MELTCGSTLHGFAIHTCEDLPEIEGTAYVGRHEESGARLLYLRNDDNNKSFAIGFRTPPRDDTGVFHILEHSVLCGSRRFPVKEPFVDLLKGSMQTFLNAMTFGDKTLFPVASTNERDLRNLMDVYLDAVFHPQIYSKRAIFEQEGWHYELVANDGKGDPAALSADETTLVHNGVVFNEMKGALSDAESVLYDEMQKALFPDTCYAFESGGTPQAIPTLTYEDFLDEHRCHYRTDNSYIILYGNLDIDATLAFLDERYLTPVAAEQREADRERSEAGLEPLLPRAIEFQEPVIPAFYRRTMDTAPENACAACGYVLGKVGDRTRTMAVDMLVDALFGSNEAPLKRALLDAGIAHDVSTYLSDAIAQPFVFVQLHMPAEGAAEKLHDLIVQNVTAILDAGLDKQLVEAALSHEEFVMREHDMGAADGVIDAITSLSSWLYDDDAPIDYLRYEDAFSTLREALSGDYFETLCRELFCENDHRASVEIVPAPGKPDDDSAERLARMNRDLTRDERTRIVEQVALLRQLQEAPDAPEAIATLPRLTVDDIGDMPEDPAYGLDEAAPIRCIRHRVATRGIAYAFRYFDAGCLAFEDLPYLSVLALVLGKLGTAQHTAAEIDTLTQGKLGNLSFYTAIVEREDNIDFAQLNLAVNASALSENVGWLAGLPREIMLETDFSDAGKILDVLKQRKISLEQGFANSGHTCASQRVKSYCSPAGMIREQLSNVDFYRFLYETIEHFDERAEAIAERLALIASHLFCDDNCTISFAGSDSDYDAFWRSNPGCGRTGDGGRELVVPPPVKRNEAFIVPTDVCFASLGWDWRLFEPEYSGSWLVAGRALALDYLWNEVRVKGGAYGVGFQTRRNGIMRFHSYRDPHLDETIARFGNASTWLADFSPSDEEMDGFVVATVASLDAPTKPRTIIRRQAAAFFCGNDPEDRRKLRDQAIATDVDAVRAFAEPIMRLADERAICVFGNREILEGSKEGLDVINLVG